MSTDDGWVLNYVDVQIDSSGSQINCQVKINDNCSENTVDIAFTTGNNVDGFFWSLDNSCTTGGAIYSANSYFRRACCLEDGKLFETENDLMPLKSKLES